MVQKITILTTLALAAGMNLNTLAMVIPNGIPPTKGYWHPQSSKIKVARDDSELEARGLGKIAIKGAAKLFLRNGELLPARGLASAATILRHGKSYVNPMIARDDSELEARAWSRKYHVVKGATNLQARDEELLQARDQLDIENVEDVLTQSYTNLDELD